MKDDIRNIINLENITRVRSSITLNTKIPAKDSIVKLIPVEYLEQGLKVLIDGKLFIAFIDGQIPIKEEIIAVVTNSHPFSLSLNLSSLLKADESSLINHILKKLKLSKKKFYNKVIPKVIREDKYIIKSRLIKLEELMKNFNSSGLEFSLLVDLIWSNRKIGNEIINDLYFRLFDEPFEEVCTKLFHSINFLLFAELPQYLIKQFNDTLIYNPNSIDHKTLLNKIEPLSDLIKHFNGNDATLSKNIENEINTFIHYGTKYILQKSVLKEYEFFPDFVAVKTDSEIILVHYSIKRVFNSNNQVVHKIIFKNDNLPFQLKAIIRNNFLEGDLKLGSSFRSEDAKNNFEQNLFNHWGFRSEIKVNQKSNNEYYISKIDSGVNKLVS